MRPIRLGDRVRIDIPDESDPDFEYHGCHGLVIGISRETGRVTVGLEGQNITLEASPRDVRPSIDEPRLKRSE